MMTNLGGSIMKKNYLWKLLVLFAGVLAIGCNRDLEPTEELNPEQNGVELVTEAISAVADEGSTKAQIAEDGATFTWSIGDRVAVRTDAGWYLSNALTEAGESVSFTVSYGGTREAFAIFPSGLVFQDADHVYSNSNTDNGSGSNNLTVNLPSSYALSEVSGDNAPCPMIATNTAGSGWNFKHLCGLLRLTINGIPTDATTLTLDFLGRKMSGAFTIENGNLVPGNASCVITSDNGDDDKITITDLTGASTVTVNIPLPTGDYDDIVVTSNSSTKLMAIRHIKPTSLSYIDPASGQFPPLSVYTASRAHRRKLTATLVSFSVSDSKKVAFAPANLVATVTAISEGLPTAVSWAFHGNPGDVAYSTTTSNAYGSSKWVVGKQIDAFGWGTSGWNSGVASWSNYQPWSTSRTNHSGDATYAYNIYGYGPDSNCLLGYGDSGYQEEWDEKAASQSGLWGTYANGDWGVYNQIGPYPAGTWRTPRALEWNYLINERTVTNTLHEGARGLMARVYEKRPGYTGDNWECYYIIFPDNYVHPAGVEITGSPVWDNSSSSFGAIIASYSDFEKMEAAGALMLFAAGARGGEYNTTYSPYGSGNYWTSDAELFPRSESQDNPKGENTRFTFGGQSPRIWGTSRFWGYSVRLIRDLN